MVILYNIIDLFAGCGGFSEGFKLEGFQVIAANEFWEPAIETYKYNHGSTRLIEGDITLKEIKQQIYDSVKDEKINVIIGGPPCQAYSISGNRNPDDPRGKLYLDFIEMVDHVKPDFFIMENVKGLIHMKHLNPHLSKKGLAAFKDQCSKLQRYKDLKRYKAQRELNEEEEKDYSTIEKEIKSIKKEINKNLIPLLDIILEKMREINYKVEWRVLNAANYGVPQTRERIIFIGTKHEQYPINFPKMTHFNGDIQTTINEFSEERDGGSKKKAWNTAGETLKKYEKWPEVPEKNHLFTKHSKTFIQKLHDTPIGETVYKNYSDAWRRLDPKKPAKTVKENHGGVFVHFELDRVCTPRELAALQSFSDSFIFRGTKSSILKQIGNAVPPLLAKAIGKQVKSDLDRIYGKTL